MFFCKTGSFIIANRTVFCIIAVSACYAVDEGIHLSVKTEFPELSYSLILAFFIATDHGVSLVSGEIPNSS